MSTPFQALVNQGIGSVSDKVRSFLQNVDLADYAQGARGIPGSVADYATDVVTSPEGSTTAVLADILGLAQGMRQGIMEDPLRSAVELNPVAGAASDLFESTRLMNMAQEAEDQGDAEKAQTLRELGTTIVLMGMVPGLPKGSKNVDDALEKLAKKRQKLMEETGLPYVPGGADPGMGSQIDPFESPQDTALRRSLEQKRLSEQVLDRSTPAREARAEQQGYIHDVFHGTRAPEITEVDESLVDLGIHVGSYDQANNRLLQTRIFEPDKGANILPLKVKMENILEMKDVGDWGNSVQVLTEMERLPELRAERQQISEALSEAEELQEQFRFGEEEWRDSPENRQLLDEAKLLITNKGYDSISYINEVENMYGKEAPIRPEIQNKITDLAKQANKIEESVRQRMPKPPLPDDPDAAAKIEEFTSAKYNDYRTPEEAEAELDITKRINRLRNNKANYLDNRSYIILDPRNVRSKFADFDPARAGSSDLQAGIGSFGIMRSLT